MRVCLLHSRLDEHFRALGHEVLSLRPDGGILDLEPLLGGFQPELILQQEALGPRVILRDLEHFSCPRLFWSIDPHLNAFWHAVYGRLFDAVPCTQSRWTAYLKDSGLPNVHRLPWYGSRQPFVPFVERSRDMGFVGRVTPVRPSRARMVEFLTGRCGLQTASDLFGPDMFAFYRDTRLAPNESILGEANFRLFEAASCGCLVLNPDIGPELDDLYEPGQEIMPYAHALELLALARRYSPRPEDAEAIGRAAWARTQAEHLPEHRASAILDIAASAPRRVPARQDLPLAAFAAWEAGRLDCGVSEFEPGLVHAQPTAETLTALIRLWTMTGRVDLTLGTLSSLLQEKRHPDGLRLNMAASAAGLRFNSWTLARAFLLRAEEAAAVRPSRPESPAALCLAWAILADRAGLRFRPGLVFEPEHHLPDSAAEWLFLADFLQPGDLDILRRTQALLAGEPGLEHTRLGLLSHLSLHNREDWRLGLDLGLVNLSVFRPVEAMQELSQARAKAAGLGREALFRRILEASDPTGLALRLLYEG